MDDEDPSDKVMKGMARDDSDARSAMANATTLRSRSVTTEKEVRAADEDADYRSMERMDFVHYRTIDLCNYDITTLAVRS